MIGMTQGMEMTRIGIGPSITVMFVIRFRPARSFSEQPQPMLFQAFPPELNLNRWKWSIRFRHLAFAARSPWRTGLLSGMIRMATYSMTGFLPPVQPLIGVARTAVRRLVL